MRNLIKVVVVALCFVSVGFGQTTKKVEEKIDTARFIQILESEFNFQVNEYRRSLGLDTIPTEKTIKMLCDMNNDRLVKIPEFFSVKRPNSEYREMAHEGFDDRIDSSVVKRKPNKKSYNPRPATIPNEIVQSTMVTLTNNIDDIKEIARKIKVRFSFSKDHNETLTEKYAYAFACSCKITTVNGKDYLLITSVFFVWETPPTRKIENTEVFY